MSAQLAYPFLSGDEAELLELMGDDEHGRMWAWHVIAEGQKRSPSQDRQTTDPRPAEPR